MLFLSNSRVLVSHHWCCCTRLLLINKNHNGGCLSIRQQTSILWFFFKVQNSKYVFFDEKRWLVHIFWSSTFFFFSCQTCLVKECCWGPFVFQATGIFRYLMMLGYLSLFVLAWSSWILLVMESFELVHVFFYCSKVIN